MSRNSNIGFTLIELLIAVLVIAILAAIALPQYQKTVLKSRYSGLMPIAAAVANAQEVYYMENGHYADNNHVTELEINAPSGGISASIEVNDGEDTRFDYVLATRSDVPGLAYVVYQKHSQQFPDTIMCEANDTLNPQATWLCHDNLKGTFVETGSLLGDGWTAYLLRGVQGSSTFVEPSNCTDPKPDDISVASTGATGTAVCNEQTGKYEYSWTRQPYSSYTCTGSSEYGCAGGIYNGSYHGCNGNATNACEGSAFTNGAYCNGNRENACAGSDFSSSVKNSTSKCETPYNTPGAVGACSRSNFSATAGGKAECTARAEYGCAGSNFTGENANCYGWASNACGSLADGTPSVYTEGAKCTANSANGCTGAVFTNGGNCESQATNGCAGVTIGDHSYCYGPGCSDATYTDTGCCTYCTAGSNKPKCSYDPSTKTYSSNGQFW